MDRIPKDKIEKLAARKNVNETAVWNFLGTPMWTHRQSPPLRSTLKETNQMETSTQSALPVVVSRLVRPVCCWVEGDGSRLGVGIECKQESTHRAVFESGMIPLCEKHAPLGEKVGWKVVHESDLPNCSLLRNDS